MGFLTRKLSRRPVLCLELELELEPEPELALRRRPVLLRLSHLGRLVD